MLKLPILLYIFSFTIFFDNILAEDDKNVFKIALRKQPKFQRNAMNVIQNQKNAVDIVKLRDLGNMAYTATIKLGNPPQEFVVQIDTGSSDFWVYGPDCCGDKWKKCPERCARKNGSIASNCPKNCYYKFFPSKSNSFESTKNHFFTAYGDLDYCYGPVGKDILQIGSLEITNTNFYIANKSSERMEEDPFFHGILGMAFSKLSTSKPHRVESPLFEAMNQKLLKENLFTIFMKNSQNGGILVAGGVLTIGEIDHENCGEIIGWTDLTKDDGFWTFQIDNVSFGNGDKKFNVSSTDLAMSDTGNSYIQGPEDIVTKIYDKIGVTTNLKIPCDREYEPIVFEIAGKEYKLTKKMLTVKKSNYCEFGMLVRDDDPSDDHVWILGDPFIRQYCHIHDMANKRIGFAELKNN